MHIPINGYATSVPFFFFFFYRDCMVPVLSLNHFQGLFTYLNCLLFGQHNAYCCCDMPGQKSFINIIVGAV